MSRLDNKPLRVFHVIDGLGTGGHTAEKSNWQYSAQGWQLEHTSKNAMLTLTGLVALSNEMLPLIAPAGGGFTSAMYWSLNDVQTNSGNSNE